MLKVFEGFVGVGSQHMALRDLGIEHEVVATSDWDYHATLAYHAMHTKFPIDWAFDTEIDEIVRYLFKIKISSDGKEPMTLDQIKRLSVKKKRNIYNAFLNANNLGSITEINPKDIPEHDLFTYSFPCQDISVAGQQKGFDENSGTRSGMLWECKKVIKFHRQKYLLMENVKNLIGKKHKENFNKWSEWLESQGYTNYWQVLNAKDYEVPQNRERVFMISILGEHEPFEFPNSVELTVRLKDILEEKVDEKYYLDNEKTKALIAQLDYRATKEIKLNQVGKGEGAKILVKNATKTGYLKATDGDGIDLAYPESKTRRGRVQAQISHTITTSDNLGVLEMPIIGASRGRNPDNPSDRTPGNHVEQRLEINKNGTSNTITTVQKDNYVVEESGIYTGDSLEFHRGPLEGLSRTLKANKHDAGVTDGYRIRKLTPLECWRLMDFTDEDFYKAQAVCSNSQLYKQAGNSIVKAVLMAIFKQMFMKVDEWNDDFI